MFLDVSAYISGTSEDTENLHLPNEKYCLQLSNGVLEVSIALLVLKLYPPEKLSKFRGTPFKSCEKKSVKLNEAEPIEVARQSFG